MANIPEDGMPIKEDTDDANPDTRNPAPIKDKQILADNEFEEGKSGNKDVSNGKEEPMDTSDNGAAGDSKTEATMEAS